MMSEGEKQNKKWYRIIPTSGKSRRAGLFMAMGFAGLLIVFAWVALQELR